MFFDPLPDLDNASVGKLGHLFILGINPRLGLCSFYFQKIILGGSRMKIQKMVFASLLVAIGTMVGHVIYIPVGVAKCFPIQHTINVISAVLLGPYYAVLNAFLISLLRNILGTGSILAFPGSIFGAILASYMYKKFNKISLSALGEIIGTGIIGGLVAFPMAKFILGKEVGAFFFVVPFMLSTIGGSIIAIAVLKSAFAYKMTKDDGRHSA